MNKHNIVVRIAVVAGLVGCFAPAWAQANSTMAAAGRKVAANVAPAVITIRLVKKNTSSYEGQSSTRESKSELPGVIIDETGLVVTSLTAADPAGMFAGAAGDGMSSRSEITDAKYILPGGEEVAAKVVLRDKDLDLMFLRPVKKPSAPMPHLDLKDSASVELFDPVIVFARMGKVVNRALGGKIVNIQAVVEKPRLRYIIGTEDVTEIGCPVMSMEGKVVGLLVVKIANMGTDVTDSPSGNDGAAPVVIVAADLLRAALQAPEGAEKPAPTKPAPTKPTVKPKKT